MKTKSSLILAIIVLVTGNLQADLADGLVAYYPFNGNANDESGFNNHGTVISATLASDRFGNPNNAYSFDGIDDYVDIADSPELNPTDAITVAAWIKPSSAVLEGVYPPIVKKADSSVASGYALEFNNSTMRFFTVVEETWVYTKEISLAMEKWYLIVGVYDGSEMVLYVDGNPTSPNYFSGNITTASNNLNIGRDPANPSIRFYSGIIDEVRIYNRALNQSEVTELHNIPEPATLLLLSLGVIMLRRKQ